MVDRPQTRIDGLVRTRILEAWNGRTDLDAVPDDATISELARLVAATHERPMMAVRALVHRLLREHHFIQPGECQGTCPELLDRQTDALTDALGKVRAEALLMGLWSDVPETPQMFG